MAEEHLKYLTARLTLDTSDLDRAKGKIAKVAEETERASQSAPAATSRYEAMSKAIDDVGKVGDRLTVGVTLPMVAAGVAAFNADREFGVTFTRMQTLAGVAASEVDGLKESVKSMAVDTAQDTQTVAEGLYFIRSAGLEGSDAMDALQVSAQGAAVGLGDTASVADTVTSAMLAYGPAALSAAQAGDVLVASARAGKVEASELGPQMGRLLPLATSLGIGFDQLGAGMAFLSRQSGDASLAATQLQGVMAKLLKPAQEAEQTLAAVGLSMDQVRKVASEQGLPAALQLVSDRLGGNQQALGKVFEDVQALQGAMIFLNSDAKQVGQVFDDVKNSTGALGDAFRTTAETDAFKQQQAMTEVKNALIELGAALGPIISTAADVIGTLATVFSSLPGPVKEALTYVGLFVAALGPIMSVGSRVKQAIDTVKTAIDSVKTAMDVAKNSSGGMASGMAAGAGSMLVVGMAATGLIATIQGLADHKRRVTEATKAATAAFNDETQALNDATAAAVRAKLEEGGLAGKVNELGLTVDDLTGALNGNRESIERVQAGLKQGGDAAMVVGSQFGIMAEGYQRAAQNAADVAVAAGDISRAQGDAIVAAHTYTLEVQGHNQTIIDAAAVQEDLRIATATMTDATKDATAATEDATVASQGAAAVAPTVAAALKPAAEAWETLARKIKDVTQATNDEIDADLGYRDSIASSQEALAAYHELQDKAAKAKGKNKVSAEELDAAERRLERTYIDQARNAGDLAATTSLFQDEQSKAVASTQAQAAEFEAIAAQLGPDNPLSQRLVEYARKLRDDIPRTIVTEFGIRILPTGNEKIDRDLRLGGARKTGGDVPGPADAPVPMLLHGGEFVLSRDVVDAIKRGGPTLGMGASVERLLADRARPAGAASTTNAPQYNLTVVNHPERPWYERDAARELDRMAVLAS